MKNPIGVDGADKIFKGAIAVFAIFLTVVIVYVAVSDGDKNSNPSKSEPLEEPPNYRDIPENSIFSVRSNSGQNVPTPIIKDEESVKLCIAQMDIKGVPGKACTDSINGMVLKGERVRIMKSDNTHDGWSRVELLEGEYEGTTGMVKNTELGEKIR